MRIYRVLLLLAALLVGACACADVSYDFSDLDKRNLLRGEPD
jgi:hypothetical protein